MADDGEEFEFEYTKVTKTTRTINQRRLSQRQESEDKAPEPKFRTLYGRDPKEFENVDVEKLLGQLTADELAQLSEEVDPDDNLLPPSQRCKDQTSKSATGPLNRKQLLTFLTKFAQEQEDWPELKPFQSGVKRGKIFEPKEQETTNSSDEKIILDLDDGTEEALDDASEADLVDLAGILGLHSMLNQDQFHNSILNKGQRLGTDKFESIVKAPVPRKLPFEPDNITDPEATAKQVIANDPNLTELNWNNIKFVPRETFKKMFAGLKQNTHLKTLHLSNTGLTDGPAEVLVEALKENTTLRTISLESNYLSGPMLRTLIQALLVQQRVLEFRACNQRPIVMGNRIEMEIAKAVEQNKTLLRLGLCFDVPCARQKVTDHIQNNNDNIRLKRIGSYEG
ncbi:tropomodulin-like isoform X1 [Oppia nitens]|uniref:tropomodulin-like isoform X1 n=1 Tax=Oppia nitens TaxID=1686743 RepID=UPI0023DAD7BB|nr:tropomodulin-like isoform X1 [Oppia nitens]